MRSVPLPPVACGGSVAATRWKNWRKAGALCSRSRAKTPNAAADHNHKILDAAKWRVTVFQRATLHAAMRPGTSLVLCGEAPLLHRLSEHLGPPGTSLTPRQVLSNIPDTMRLDSLPRSTASSSFRSAGSSSAGASVGCTCSYDEGIVSSHAHALNWSLLEPADQTCIHLLGGN